jgi:serine protease Do
MRSTTALVLLLALACGDRAGAGQPPPPPPAPPPSSGEGSLVPALPSLAPLVEAVRPTVVGVTTRVEPSGRGAAADEFWRRFFEGEPGDPHGFGPGPGRRGVGSGVIIESRGIVLTNNHVVEGATGVRIRTADETEYDAEVIGADPDTDIAVLRLRDVRGPLPAAALGSSDSLRVGDPVVAIGNPFGLDLTVTQGIISAKARVIGAGPYDDFLQTDAAINPGNSGGPLFDLGGRVVGINTAIVATGQGIGFAVPIDLVKSLLPQLTEKGRVVRGFLGVGIQELTPELQKALGLKASQGALVASVDPEGPAAGAGLRPGDVIVGLDGKPVEGPGQLSRDVALLPPGRAVRLRVLRDGREREVEVTLGERPSRERAAAGGERDGPSEEAWGLSLRPVPPELRRGKEPAGALVAGVAPGSRAEEAGLLPGDRILEVNRRPVGGPEDVSRLVKEGGDGPILLRVQRGGSALFLVIPGDGR